MKPNKDIFDRFRDNQHKLNESPSRQAWERLEGRLDQHKDRNHKSIFRILSMAAAVLVLVVFVSIISFMLNPKSDHMAVMNVSPDGFATEELKVVSVSNEINNQLAFYQRKYNSYVSSPIREGNANKKLIAKTDRQHSPENQFSLAESTRGRQMQSMSFSSEPAEIKPATVENFSISSADDAKESDVEEADDKATFDSVISTESRLSEAAAENSKVVASNKAKRKMESSESEKKDRSSEAEQPAPAGSVAGYGYPSISGIQQFQWLTGKWEGNVNNQVSIEQWKKVNDKTLEGSGFLMVNNQSTFHENMKIQEIDGMIYFIADLNGTGNQIHYQLVSNDGFKAVFENQTIEFPNQVVLQRTNSTNFSTIYQNTQPGSINETQQNYYLNRNFIQKEQVVRNLRRVGD